MQITIQYRCGTVILLSPNTLYRAQATGTFMFFFNALLLGGR